MFAATDTIDRRALKNGQSRWLRLAARLIVLAAALIASQPAWPADATTSKLVVVLYPEPNDGRPGNVLADRGLRAALAAGSTERIEIHNEYLDLSRFPGAEYQQDLAAFLRRKYADRKVDFVVAGLSSALNFALEHREAFPGAAIVFMAVDRKEIDGRQLPPDVIGTPIEIDLGASLAAALQLRPDTRHVFVVVGQSKFDAFWEAKARAAFRSYGEKVEVNYLVGLPRDKLESTVASLPNSSLIYYLHVFEDSSGRIHTPAEMASLIAKNANAPVFSHVDSYVGRGIVGGRVFSFEQAGQDAGRLGLRVLAGEDPARIGIQPTSKSAYIFDARELDRWGIATASLPAGSEVRYREPTLWDRYKWNLAGLMSLVGLQAVLIAGLLVQRSRRARAEQQFRQAVDAAPNGVLMVGGDGQIVLVNKQLERLFGYRSAELVGRKVEVLMPERYRAMHPGLRHGFFAHPEERPMGAGRELFALRKDGTEFPVEIGLSSMRTPQGMFVLASVIDMTERRRVECELRESHEELRRLAAEILGAQEMERRRIARELHDDFGQDLALVSVELDLLQQRPPASADEAQARIQEVSDRVKHLSSSIHDLSHQLHPMKLEQLGLIAAIRGLCKELSQNHGVRLDFTDDDSHLSPSPEVALCLYRVTQEALRNVVKHSGAASASVRLRTLGETLALEVRDAGRGLDPADLAAQGGLGLVSMRERLRLVDGELTVESQPGEGVHLLAQVPLSTASSASIQSVTNATSR